MVNTYFKILYSLFISLFVCDLYSQNLDSLSVNDSNYDSILKSDEEAISTLFYKHKNNVLLNNLGPYGSSFYYPTTYFLKEKNLIEKPNKLKTKLQKISGFKPYTNISYFNASRKEQQLSLTHVQEFGKLLSLDFKFLKLNSPGIYTNQEADNMSFAGNLEYQSKKRNYKIIFSTEIYRNFYEENGGLVNVKDYENTAFDDERNYSVNLQNSNSFQKKYNYSLNQNLDLFKLNYDSIEKIKVYLKHQLSYSTQQKVFNDNDPLSNIYNVIHFDSISSVDSIYSNCISNTGCFGVKNNRFSFELFGQYDQKEYKQTYGINSVYHNTYLGIRSALKKKELNLFAIAKYGVDGYRAGDVESELVISYGKEKYSLHVGSSYFLNEPDLKFLSYNSNHYIWNNTDFEKQSIYDFNLDFKLKKIQLDFTAETKLLTNTLYYDSSSVANQDDNTQSITSFSLAKNYKILNFHFRTAFIYQLTSDKYLFPLPELIGRQILYYQKYIFKGALKFQFGVGFSYSTDYYGYAYMPAINEFYVQSNTSLGYYPKVDVFINTHLKRAQIFLKYEHINSGNSLSKSYVTPGYPSLNRSLKFGVSWNMFD